MELLESVKTNYAAFKERPPQQRYGDRYSGDGYSNGGGQGYGDRGDRGDRDRNSSYSYGGGYGGQGSYGGQNDTQSPAGGANAADINAQWAAYYQNAGQDPYAAYGGYEAYMQMWQQHYYGQGAAQQSPAPGLQPLHHHPRLHLQSLPLRLPHRHLHHPQLDLRQDRTARYVIYCCFTSMTLYTNVPQVPPPPGL